MDKILSILMTLLVLTSIIAGCTISSDPKKEIANELSEKIKITGKIDSSLFDDYSKFQDTIGKINRIVRIVNEKTGTTIPEMTTSSSDYEKFKILLKYSPLIGSYDDLYESATILPSMNDSDYNNFYIDLTKFSFDFGILQSQVSYHVAYRATGEIASTFGLKALTPYIGNEAYSAILSGVHWTFRGVIDNQTDVFFNFVKNQVIDSTNLSVNSS